MKKIGLKYAVALCLVAAFSCKNNSSNNSSVPEQSSPPHAPQQTSVHLPLPVAMAGIHRYDSICKALFHDSIPIRAYTIHAADLLESLGIPKAYADSAFCKYKHVRVYLGLDSAYKFRLYFTPVEGADLDPNNRKAGRDVILGNPGGGPDSQYVLDLNAPCPTTCDLESPLYQPN